MPPFEVRSQSFSVACWPAEISLVPVLLKASSKTGSVWPRRRPAGAARAEIPEADGAVQTSGREALAVGAEGDCVDPAGGGGEASERLAGVWIPDSYAAIGTAGGDQAALGIKRDTPCLTLMAAQDECGGARCGLREVPDADGSVLAGGGEPLAVGAPGDAEDSAARASDLERGG